MPAKKNKSYTAEFKAKVALDAIKGDLTINEISSKYGVHSTQINRWKQQALASLKTCFNGKQEKALLESQQQMDKRYQQIGQLTCESDFLQKSVWS
ncbi:transposase [Cysteiniphilum litorale]|uniref:transposase n=1 Tax=Cysteiniphilum litorale TaxID=2056700 RepID=UPI003F882797